MTSFATGIFGYEQTAYTLTIFPIELKLKGSQENSRKPYGKTLFVPTNLAYLSLGSLKCWKA